MKKKTKLFKHFITILNILACSVPLLAFAIVTLQDVLPKYFTSLGMQHHGDGSSTFDDDLNALTDSNQFKDMNYHMLYTLDRLDYFNYDITGYRQVQLPTNVVNSLDDLHIGSYYHLNINNRSIDEFVNFNDFALTIELYNVVDYSFGDYEFAVEDIVETQLNISKRMPSVILQITTSETYFDFSLNDNSEDFYFVSLRTFALDNYSFVLNCDIKILDINYLSNYISFSPFSSTEIYEYVAVDGYDNFDDFIDYENGRTYQQIIHDTYTHLPLNIDFISLFTQSEIINRNGNVAIYLFINYYMNYLINILIILFLPELTIIFFFMLKNLTYKLIDKEI